MPKLPLSCSADTTFLEPDLAKAWRTKTLDYIDIIELPEDELEAMEIPSGFYVVVKLKRSSQLQYLATKRDRDNPRLFKHLERLTRMLRKVCPTGTVTLHQNTSQKVNIATRR